ncbi:M23 family metallopeptidase [Flavobacterium sp. F372]|uniref:M23 family metallopeptidase n=1 Tax=Flavobacterium bernardetii TaxID=2813823 RepID=A0ABR7J259_9FLAO|nr:M23 family metallopeptidase [Flavobacterium bernardetii]MBC5836105.1 M23 family metallopeptidase [Flavobacterium bernardetii]NHF71290.1 M23 family metallopeptidase [Flavobacterium bernardetii]
MKKSIAILLVLASQVIFAQYPKDYFRSPLDIPINLSGTFGELRPNHFHSGLDIRTNNVEGLPVYAAADGIIIRIKVSAFGYGKALYVAHPNGYTTVYGHLQKFSDKIEAYVKEQQYRQKSYEVELYPSTLKVTQSEIIALSGNSGGSGGPHLHFEFRDTATEKIINPMAFGMNKLIKDEMNPVISSLMVYPANDSTSVNKSKNPVSLSLQKQVDGSFLASKVVASGKIGFALNSYDLSTNNYNKNGIYKVVSYVNGSQNFKFEFDTFAFDESKHINYFIDFNRYKKLKQRFQKLYIKESYPLSLVSGNTKNGILDIKPNVAYTYKIEVFDFHGNKTIVNVPILFEKEVNPAPITSKGNFYIKTKSDYNFEFEKTAVYIPVNALYENAYLNVSEKDNILDIENNYEAIQNGLTVTLDMSHLSEEEQKKAFVGTILGMKLEYNSSFRKANKVSTKVKAFGKYKVGFDNVAPRIYNPNFIEGSNISKLTTLSVSISDAISGIDSYNAYLNGEWILMEYDYKTKKLVHNLKDEKVISGKNDIKIVVTDKLDNTATFSSNFIY